ncbi:MAG: tetratricopeptide repeat protein [Bacteroidetes bacterium]|nr:tetratricopeptide repeat protein [Bacteroidota bacterium]
MNEGDIAMKQDNMQKALDLYGKALELYPENPEVKSWTAVTLTIADRLEDALPPYKEAFSANDNWKEVLRRIYGTDLVKVDNAVFDTIINYE